MSTAHASRNRSFSPLRSDLRSIVADGAAYSVMVGIGETYVPAFVLALGMGAIAAGLITTIPMVAGAVLQLIVPWGVHQLGSHRRWVVSCATAQGMSLLALVAIALLVPTSGWLVFVAVTLYWSASLATGPAWNTWIEGLVPKRLRPRFFASRTRVTQVAVLAGFISGGLVLQWWNGNNSGSLMAAFALLFGVAAICRFISATFLARQSETKDPTEQPHVGLRQLLRRGEGGPGTTLLVYLLLVQCAVYIAAPFFTPFMLNEIGFSYIQYMVLTAIAVTAKVVALPRIGRLAERVGGRRLLWIGGLGIVPLSSLWVVSQSMVYLALVQILSGIAWAIYELAMFLMFFETIPRVRRTSVLTLYNLGNALAMVGGSLLGALLLRVIGPGTSAYLTLFFVSSIARLSTVMILTRIQEVMFVTARPATRTVAVRPSAGTVEQPILPTMPRGQHVAKSED